jgi:hypothetical protein
MNSQGLAHSPEGGLIPTALVERLEVAEAGSRELDALIDAATAATDGSFEVCAYEWDGVWFSGEFAPGEAPRSAADYPAATVQCIRQSMPVTTSLDAALALAERVLPGWWRELGETGFKPPNSFWKAAVFSATPSGESYDTARVVAFGNTGPLALCIAILKATTASSVGTSASECTHKDPDHEG